ncbi:hypothetical protein KP509_15G057600 [Ceratopteris richardii]|uniref:Uncharacterized protein n=1 Tax=Ceratopteris richardii TaxID=49495 RepID=A0A8T2T7F0_CERRI|nr:hypothetical protein KP509_15G057600 [Ceratopteris richardii]
MPSSIETPCINLHASTKPSSQCVLEKELLSNCGLFTSQSNATSNSGTRWSAQTSFFHASKSFFHRRDRRGQTNLTDASLHVAFQRTLSNVEPNRRSDNAAVPSLRIRPYAFSFDQVELPPIPKVFSPLKDIGPPKFEKVGGQLLVKAGSKNDPSNKVGLATTTSIVQRSGGTRKHPGDILDNKLEELAARIESSSGIAEMSVGFRCLSEDLMEVISLFSEVIQMPSMPASKLDLARTQLLGSIKRRGDNPGGIAAREFSKLLYGEKSAYSRYFTEDTLRHIARDDLIVFHENVFWPTASVLGIWGDFDKDSLKDVIFSKFGSWNASQAQNGLQDVLVDSFKQWEVGNSFREPHIYVVNKPGLNQGFVRMGELGTTVSDPDVFALDVLNDILNGFGGLLFDQVRSKEGLAYSVYGGWTPAVEHRGSFLAGGETQINTVPQFILSVEKVLEEVTLKAPSEEELAKAKEGIINSFVFNFIDSGVQLSRIMTYDLYGIDPNFLLNYKKKVEELTSIDILEAAKRHLHPRNQPILVVADAARVIPALKTLGREIVVLHPEYLPETI